MADYSTDKKTKYTKYVAQMMLIALVWYQCHVAMRDVDKTIFENRIHESLRWLHANHPYYRLYIFNEFGIDRVNCTENQLYNMIDFIAPTTVQAHA
jgi:hypothetical protein